MTNALKIALTTIVAAAALFGAAAAQDLNHTNEAQTVLILNDFQARTELVLTSKIDAKINTLVAAATKNMTALPAFNAADLNNFAVASTKSASQDLTLAMTAQIDELIANGPEPISFALAQK
ncbi:MAG: hypothetical protein V3V30_09480 [Parvularculaceae bacterium]